MPLAHNVGQAFRPRHQARAAASITVESPVLRNLSLYLLASLAVFTLLACSDDAPAGPEPTADPGPQLILINKAGKTATLSIEIAVTTEQKRTGLSNRESLPPNAGMLFILERRGAGFWMRDTLIPLSLAFISTCGQIVHIAHMEPLTLTLHNAPGDYYFGLEVNQGWFEQNAIAVGDTVQIPAAHRVAGCT